MLTRHQFTCTVSEVPKSTCALTDFNCVCTNKQLNDNLLVCLQAGCTVIEQLTTQRVVQTMCGAPVRDMSKGVTAIIWAFFGAATVAVFLRIVGRLPMLGGEFSWDDYTIFACMVRYPPLCIFSSQLYSFLVACISALLGHCAVDGEPWLGSGHLDAYSRSNFGHAICECFSYSPFIGRNSIAQALTMAVLLHRRVLIHLPGHLYKDLHHIALP